MADWADWPRILSMTGTRRGITPAQRARALEVLAHVGRLCHGAAAGADTDLHLLAHSVGVPCDLYPADDVPSNLAFLAAVTPERPWNYLCEGCVVHPAGPALERNKDIVLAGEALLAFPGGFREELRSGTWAAIRYARRAGRPILIVWPDGTVSRENRT